MEESVVTLALFSRPLFAPDLRQELNRLRGLRDVSLDFARRTLRVVYDPRRVTPGEIRNAVWAAGYVSQPVHRPGKGD